MNDSLAGDVSLHLGLVCPVDDDPAQRSSNGDGPESVTSQRVHVKAGGTGRKTTVKCSGSALLLFICVFHCFHSFHVKNIIVQLNISICCPCLVSN